MADAPVRIGAADSGAISEVLQCGLQAGSLGNGGRAVPA